MQTLKSVGMLFADASIAQTIAGAVGAILVLAGVRVDDNQLVIAFLAISAAAHAVEAKLAQRAVAKT